NGKMTRIRKGHCHLRGNSAVVKSLLLFNSRIFASFEGPSFGCGALVKDGVEEAQLKAKRLSIRPALLLLVTVECFKSNAETFSRLPHEVQGCVMCLMIGIKSL